MGVRSTKLPLRKTSAHGSTPLAHRALDLGTLKPKFHFAGHHYRPFFGMMWSVLSATTESLKPTSSDCFCLFAGFRFTATDHLQRSTAALLHRDAGLYHGSGESKPATQGSVATLVFFGTETAQRFLERGSARSSPKIIVFRVARDEFWFGQHKFLENGATPIGSGDRRSRFAARENLRRMAPVLANRKKSFSQSTELAEVFRG